MDVSFITGTKAEEGQGCQAQDQLSVAERERSLSPCWWAAGNVQLKIWSYNQVRLPVAARGTSTAEIHQCLAFVC